MILRIRIDHYIQMAYCRCWNLWRNGISIRVVRWTRFTPIIIDGFSLLMYKVKIISTAKRGCSSMELSQIIIIRIPVWWVRRFYYVSILIFRLQNSARLRSNRIVGTIEQRKCALKSDRRSILFIQIHTFGKQFDAFCPFDGDSLFVLTQWSWFDRYLKVLIVDF